MTWTDITSYSRMETARTPRVFECSLTPHVSFKVHKHICFGDAWLLTASCVNLEHYDLETNDLEIAKENAATIMSRKLQERREELNAALSQLSPAARWVCDDDDQGSWRCSECGYEAMPADWFCTPYEEEMNFCPRCGAKMQRDDQSENEESEDEGDTWLRWSRKKDGTCCLNGCTCVHDSCGSCPVHQCYACPATYDEEV